MDSVVRDCEENVVPGVGLARQGQMSSSRGAFVSLAPYQRIELLFDKPQDGEMSPMMMLLAGAFGFLDQSGDLRKECRRLGVIGSYLCCKGGRPEANADSRIQAGLRKVAWEFMAVCRQRGVDVTIHPIILAVYLLFYLESPNVLASNFERVVPSLMKVQPRGYSFEQLLECMCSCALSDPLNLESRPALQYCVPALRHREVQKQRLQLMSHTLYLLDSRGMLIPRVKEVDEGEQ